MTTHVLKFNWLLCFVIIIFSLSGCSLSYVIDEPVPSSFEYSNLDNKVVTIKINDKRQDNKFMVGISSLSRIDMNLDNVINPIYWFSDKIEKEFKSRGIPVKIIDNPNENADIIIDIKNYQIINYRVSGFSAWEAYHVFLGNVTMGSKSCSIPAFFFNSKLPIWSMEEINKPCLSDPMSIIVKEVVSKINKCLFNYKVDDKQLQKLITAANSSLMPEPDSRSCFDAINLGSSNNSGAINILKQIASHNNSYIRSCAISAIGILGIEDQLDFLSKKFNFLTNNDKIMPIKAIGDMKTDESVNFIRNIKGTELYNDENGVKYCVELYLSE